MRIFVTGGAGFIGSNFIRHILADREDVHILNYDKLTYAGNLENLVDVQENYSGRYDFVKGDICDEERITALLKNNDISAVINFAAETHVDRSILDASDFVQTNVVGTKSLLEASMSSGIDLFFQISTDEVYGSLGKSGAFTEEHVISPNSPYSASKAAADHFVSAYHTTYKLPTVITRCSNNYGPFQFPEKLIPVLVLNAAADKELPIYGDGKNVRDWIHVDDHSDAVITVLEKGDPGEVYNIGGDCELENIRIAEKVLDILDKPHDLITYVKDRPGHDRRYAMDFTRLRDKTGWEPKIDFKNGLRKTVQWYVENTAWIEGVVSGEYMEYYRKNYSGR